ncbi:ribosome-inactivating family protein [Spiroplasma endosymbiont of Calodromius spilotus]|uniref:ribosome-inactivating family protein n=1 Tax=Spiroplasma endosymbiont of Calodromius spilotus TaxID=3077929 RepID=UPI0031FE4CA0
MSNENHEIELVFDTSNLYLEGIINIDKNHNKTYWYFSDSKIKNLDNNITSESLHFSGNYSSLVGEDTIEISRKNINNSISNLSNITKENRHTIKNDLVRTVFITSESMRFFSVRDSIKKILIDDNKKVIWQDHKNTLNDWGKYSKKYYEMIETGITPENEEEKIINIAVLAPKDYEK